MTSADRARPAAVLCAGIAVLDQIFRVKDFPAPGTKAHATDFVTVNGGCAGNAAVAVARLGGRASYAGPLGGPSGADASGDRILASLARERVDTSGVVRVEDIASPLSMILLDAQGERTIVTYRDARLNAARPADAAALLRGVDALLIDNRYPDFILPVCRAARGRGLPIVLDADMPAGADDPLLGLATHVVFSAEALRSAPGSALDRDLARLAGAGGTFFAVTDGPNDILWLEGGEVRRMPAFPVVAVDTIGAGDVFHGAFALALAEGQAEQQALRFAAAAAALKCTSVGGVAGTPSRPGVERLLAGA